MEEIFQQNAKIVYHFLYSLCKDESLAEELTQETFLKAIESYRRYDGSCKVSTWLCQIGKHLLYQHWSKINKYSYVDHDEELISESNTEMQAIHRVVLSEILERIKAFPPLTRQVVELRLLSDLSYKEIGKIIGKSENWTRVTYYRAKLIMMKGFE